MYVTPSFLLLTKHWLNSAIQKFSPDRLNLDKKNSRWAVLRKTLKWNIRDPSHVGLQNKNLFFMIICWCFYLTEIILITSGYERWERHSISFNFKHGLLTFLKTSSGLTATINLTWINVSYSKHEWTHSSDFIDCIIWSSQPSKSHVNWGILDLSAPNAVVFLTDWPVKRVCSHLVQVDKELAAVFQGGTHTVSSAASAGGLVFQQPLEGLSVGGEHTRGSQLLSVWEAAQEPEGKHDKEAHVRKKWGEGKLRWREHSTTAVKKKGKKCKWCLQYIYFDVFWSLRRRKETLTARRYSHCQVS